MSGNSDSLSLYRISPTRRVRFIFSLTDAHPKTVLLLIVALALALDLILLVIQPVSMDIGRTDRFRRVIQNLETGKGMASCEQAYFPFCGPQNQASASLEPLPVMAFFGVMKLAGLSLWPAGLLELALNLSIVVGIFCLASQVTSRRVALLAALLWALYIPAMKLIPQISGDLFATSFLTFALFFVLRARSGGRWRDWFSAGVLLGLGILSRAATLFVMLWLVLGILLAPLLARKWERVKAGFGQVVLLSSVSMALVFPWALRNYLVLGQPIVGSSLFGYVLYRQNYMLGSDPYLRIVGSEEALKAVTDLVSRHPEINRTFNEAQMDAFYRAEALKIIAAHPVKYAVLSAYRFLPLWFDWGTNQAYGKQDDALDYLTIAIQVVLLLLALVGVMAAWQKSWLLWIIILIYSLAYMGVNAQLRYLIPVMPLVIVFSAIGIQALYYRWRGVPFGQMKLLEHQTVGLK